MTVGTINNNLYGNAWHSKLPKTITQHEQNTQKSFPFDFHEKCKINNLPEDSQVFIGPDTPVNPYSSYLRQTQYNDAETNEVIPVNIHYVTNYSDVGITCVRYKEIGSKSETEELWSIKYEKKDDGNKVNNFLNSFSENDPLTFASQKEFWIDFLSNKIDVADFKNYYSSTNNGIINFTEQKQEGESLRTITEAPYSKYLNNKSFVGHVYTENDLQPSWYKNGALKIETVYDPNVPTSTNIKSSISMLNEKKNSSSEAKLLNELKESYLQDLLQKYSMQNLDKIFRTSKEETI